MFPLKKIKNKSFKSFKKSITNKKYFNFIKN